MAMEDGATTAMMTVKSPQYCAETPQQMNEASEADAQDFAEDDPPPIDPALRAAYLHPRNKATIDKLDDQFEIFLNNRTLQQITLNNVAPHNQVLVELMGVHFKFKVTTTERTMVLAKTEATTPPLFRFGKKAVENDKAQSKKVPTIMRRAEKKDSSGGHRARNRGGGDGGKRSVVEREHDYAQVRSRIFNDPNAAAVFDDTDEGDFQPFDHGFGASPVGPGEFTESFVAAGRGGPVPRQVMQQLQWSQAGGPPQPAAPPPPNGSVKYTRRNKTEEMLDPDYDRNYSRYAPRFAPPGSGFASEGVEPRMQPMPPGFDPTSSMWGPVSSQQGFPRFNPSFDGFGNSSGLGSNVNSDAFGGLGLGLGGGLGVGFGSGLGGLPGGGIGGGLGFGMGLNPSQSFGFGSFTNPPPPASGSGPAGGSSRSSDPNVGVYVG